jgi:hypothetical protein
MKTASQFLRSDRFVKKQESHDVVIFRFQLTCIVWIILYVNIVEEVMILVQRE